MKSCFVVILGWLCFAIAESAAAPVTAWIVVDPQTGATVSNKISNEFSDSPTLGNGTVNNADMLAIYADISGQRDGVADISLSNGQKVTLSGFATMVGINTSNEQFRWGLFCESTSPFNAVNWSGFMASNSSNSSGGALRAKAAGDGTTFAQTGSAITLQSANDGDDFIDETYHFTMTVSRFNDELSVDATLTSADDWSQVWKNAIVAPPLPTTLDFNRVGFLSGGGMNADQIAFSNIDVSTSPIAALTLQVFTSGPDAGKMQIRNNSQDSFEIEYYEITSQTASLNSDGWTSLDTQEGTDAEFAGWEEAAGNDATLLSEYRLSSPLTVGITDSLSLGKAFDVGANEDLQFSFGLADGTLARGVIEYVSEGITGDFNRDGTVDAADYVAWRKGLGSSYIADDYDLWRIHFSESEGGEGGTNSSVPEPATTVASTFIVAMLLAIRKRSC